MKKTSLFVLMVAMVVAVVAKSFSPFLVSAFAGTVDSAEVSQYPAPYAAAGVSPDSLSVAVSSKSQPLTFTNESDYSWTVGDGYIQNGNCGHAKSASRLSATFTIDRPSKFSFDWLSARYLNNGFYSYSYAYQYHTTAFVINGRQYSSIYNNTNFAKCSVVLTPGTYTVEWVDTMLNTSDVYYSRIRNIELSSDWLDIDLAKAGTLGVEVLYKVNVLNDVELLKVRGNINSDDLAAIKNMKNLTGLDLSEAKFGSVPDYAFDGLYKLSYVVLPDGVTGIGQYAFRGTQLLNIDIPATVTTIGQCAFSETRLEGVRFASGSQLRYIGYRAFYNTSISEFQMPDGVTKLGSFNGSYDSQTTGYDTEVFRECKSLKKLHFSDALTVIERNVCYGCSSLQEMHLPANLVTIRDNAFYQTSALRSLTFPESLRTIGYSAFCQTGLVSVVLPERLTSLGYDVFYDSDNIEYIELPSYVSSYNRPFYDCDGVRKVVCKSATPPSVSEDLFLNGSSKSNITLVVPSFAVANYKLNTYWYQFGSIQEMDADQNYWRIAGALSLTNNRRMNGTPDVELYYGGQLTVGGNAPMAVHNFDIFVNESNPGRLLNDCPSMTADSVTTRYWVDANQWYFLTPLHDIELGKVSHSNNASFVFRYYDADSRAANGTGSSWKNVDDGRLAACRGYIFQCNSSGWVIMPANVAGVSQVFCTSDVTVPLSAHESSVSANKNWNYVGNPYPAYYDIYYMDFTAPVTVWTGSTYKAYSVADDNLVLRPMQSFFVQKPDAVDAIVFRKDGRQLSSAVERSSQAKTRARLAGVQSRRIFNLEISDDDNLKDETRVVLNESATVDYELECDASKFMSVNATVPQLFTLDDGGNRYAINERPQAGGSVALGYLAPSDGFYTICAVKAEGDITLFDRQQGKYVDLSAQDYTFYAKATGGADCSRFVLLLKASGGDPTGISGIAVSKTGIEGCRGCVSVDVASDADIVVNTLGGAAVYHGRVQAGHSTLPLPSGVYIVKVGGTSAKVVVY